MLHLPRLATANNALRWSKPVFVKPAHGKPFRGFVLQADRNSMNDAATQQLERLLELPANELVWVSAALTIASSWRYYVLHGEVIGFAPFEPPGKMPPTFPEVEELSAIVAAIPKDAAYALDMAVLEDGQTTLLCVRDGWALELFPFGADRPRALDYLRLLWARWADLVTAARVGAAANSELTDAPTSR